MFEGTISAKLADKFFEKSIFKIIKRRATIAALLLAIPDFGFGGVIYVFLLWNMYTKISDKIGISFSENKGKLIGVGFIVNILVAFVLDFAMTALFFIQPFLVYMQFYFSGKMFVETIKELDSANQLTRPSTATKANS